MTDLLKDLEAVADARATWARLNDDVSWKYLSLLCVNLVSDHHAEIAEAVADARRMDFLQREVDEIGAFLLHNGKGKGSGFTGLGLQNTGRTLRQAIDQCMSAIDAQHNSAREG